MEQMGLHLPTPCLASSPFVSFGPPASVPCSHGWDLLGCAQDSLRNHLQFKSCARLLPPLLACHPPCLCLQYVLPVFSSSPFSFSHKDIFLMPFTACVRHGSLPGFAFRCRKIREDSRRTRCALASFGLHGLTGGAGLPHGVYAFARALILPLLARIRTHFTALVRAGGERSFCAGSPTRLSPL